jgi:hypothetical protein
MSLYELCFINLEKEIIVNINDIKKYKLTGISVLLKKFYKGGLSCNPSNNNNIINSTSKNLICTENIVKFKPIFLEN